MWKPAFYEEIIYVYIVDISKLLNLRKIFPKYYLAERYCAYTIFLNSHHQTVSHNMKTTTNNILIFFFTEFTGWFGFFF